MKKLLVALTAVMLLSFSASSITIHVPGDQPTIQAGIDNASDGDTVLVADGTFTGTGNKNLNYNGKAIVVISENGAEYCIIDCENSGRGFYFNSEEDSTSILEGFKIINGNIGSGYGGGIYCYDSSPAITNCTISGNTAGSSGGGICCRDCSNPKFDSCVINGNISVHGGGIYCGSCAALFSNCVISDNFANGNGGGIKFTYGNTFITHCIIVENSANSCGGGIYISSGIPIIENCTIVGNSANTANGLYVTGSSTIIVNNIFYNNVGSSICVMIESPYFTSISYCDFYNNSYITFSGDLPPSLGQISWTNVNGDPCDYYNNIFLNPLFINPINGNYNLHEDSPCIDAGDPESPLNPDGSNADIGAFYFHHYTLLTFPSEIDFGTTRVGTSSENSLWIINDSDSLSTVIIRGISITDTAYSNNYSPIDSILTAGDSLELTVYFEPYDTTNFSDTLTVFFSVDTIQAYLIGEGIASIIQAEPNSLIFPQLELWMDTTLFLQFHNPGSDTLEFYEITTSDPVFTIDFPTIGENIPPGGTSDTCWVTFAPAEEILYEDSLFVLCNAFNAVNDTFMVYLRGEGGIVPDTVRNLTIDSLYPNAVLTWDPVTTSIYGSPITVDCYLVYFKQVLGETFNFLSIAIDTTFTHENVVQFSPSMFYEVEAYIGEIGELEGFLLSTGEVISREEVYELLK